MGRLKGRHGRSPCDTGTILLDRIGNTDYFSRSLGGRGAGRMGGGVYVSVVVDRENKVQGSEGGGERSEPRKESICSRG